MRTLGLITMVLLGGCNPTSEQGASATRTKPSPVATVAKVLGKGHVPSSSRWASLAECDRALKAAGSRSAAPARIATWNVRYFPDGSADGADEAQHIDLDWLACSIALLNVDVLSVQEFKRTERAQKSAAELLDKLNQRSGRRYKLELAHCETDDVARPGIIYDEARSRVASVKTALSTDQKCSDAVPPELTAYVKLDGGPDFHLVVIHAPAGDRGDGHRKRQTFLQGLDRLITNLPRSNGDTDIVVTGDFNTSGCQDCQPKLDSVNETRRLGERISKFRVPLRLLPADRPCSFVLENEPMLLDHFLVSADMKGLAPSATAVVSGYCEEAQCKDVFPTSKAEKRLSDHCPVVLDLPRVARD